MEWSLFEKLKKLKWPKFVSIVALEQSKFEELSPIEYFRVRYLQRVFPINLFLSYGRSKKSKAVCIHLKLS